MINWLNISTNVIHEIRTPDMPLETFFFSLLFAHLDGNNSTAVCLYVRRQVVRVGFMEA